MTKHRLEPRACIEPMKPYQPGKPVEELERELGIAEAVKLASNESALGCSKRVKQAVAKAMEKVHIYPDGACYQLRQALAGQCGCSPDELLLGNGSNELLILLGMAYLNPGDEVLSSQGSFVVYETVAQLADAAFIATPLRDHAYDLEAMAKSLTPKTKLVFIANPNNPTGTLLDAKVLRNFINRMPTSCLIVLDEAYIEYVDPKAAGNSLDWVRERKNLVVLRTFSKAYGLAGLRVGYGIAPQEIVETINKVRTPFNVNSLAQAAALAALSDKAFMKKNVALAKVERKRVAAALQAMGLKPVASQTNFIYVRIDPDDCRAKVDALMRQGVIIRPFADGYARITLGKVRENNQLLKAMREIIK